MKKYFQITVVLGGFFFLAFLKNLRGQDDANPVIRPNLPVPTPLQTNQSQPQSSIPMGPMMGLKGSYKDGTYTGSVEDAYYGLFQVQATVSNGKITDVSFLQYPSDNSTSIYINSQAMPILKSEAIQAQSSQVDIVSGASDTSIAFQRSLGKALSNARI